MLGISRWTLGKDGGSYRSIQRFFHKTIPWMNFQWTLIRTHLLSSEDVILLAGDETTVTKSGKSTFGLGRFFSSIYELLDTAPSLPRTHWEQTYFPFHPMKVTAGQKINVDYKMDELFEGSRLVEMSLQIGDKKIKYIVE